MTDAPVIIGIATFDGPGRKASLRDTVSSLKKQADEIHAWDNSLQTDLGDAGKFAPFFGNEHLERYPGGAYCLTADDDLIFPPDYVERIVEGIERYGRRAVVSFHGKEFYSSPPADEWFRPKGRSKRYPCLGEVPQDRPITIPGTGTMGWHSSLFGDRPIVEADFPAPNMADIWAGKLLNDLGIPRYALAHRAGWIKHTDRIDMETTIWRRYKNDHHYRTEVFNSVPWRLSLAEVEA